ncbi:SDR family NAD(P)-dependent oxidoreductase [Streptomyces sp. NPDC058228]|uniref:SDR family NAD(P)-dependent oxidoreductase n=1 Tax=Streptomyces sp. NPDC058228 TaxID=3346390 RepID=UPI0036F00A9E
MDGELTGKIALVTGAARGIGEATARRLAELGAKVVLADVLLEEAAAVAADIGDEAIAVRLDVSKESDWTDAFRVARENFGPINVLVNNAGVLEAVPVIDTSDEQFERVVSVNLRGTFLAIRSAGREMSASGGGAIVNVGSVIATHPTETLGVYAATKGAIASLTRVAAMELGPSGVRLCVVRPGSIATPMSGPDAEDAVFPRVLAAGRIGRPSDIADAIAFAASDRASYITGSEITVDGGWSAGRYGLEAAGAQSLLEATS